MHGGGVRGAPHRMLTRFSHLYRRRGCTPGRTQYRKPRTPLQGWEGAPSCPPFFSISGEQDSPQPVLPSFDVLRGAHLPWLFPGHQGPHSQRAAHNPTFPRLTCCRPGPRFQCFLFFEGFFFLKRWAAHSAGIRSSILTGGNVQPPSSFAGLFA